MSLRSSCPAWVARTLLLASVVYFFSTQIYSIPPSNAGEISVRGIEFNWSDPLYKPESYKCSEWRFNYRNTSNIEVRLVEFKLNDPFGQSVFSKTLFDVKPLSTSFFDAFVCSTSLANDLGPYVLNVTWQDNNGNRDQTSKNVFLQRIPTSGASPVSPPTGTCVTGGICRVGDRGPGGGIVFFASSKLEKWGRYMEAAPQGWYQGRPDPLKKPFCYEKPSSADRLVNTKSSIGEGRNNSKILLKLCPNGAVETAMSYQGQGKKQWFLPSMEEQQEMYFSAKSALGLSVTGIAPRIGEYYSSSTVTEYQQIASLSVFDGKILGTLSGSNGFYIRPIRYFVSQNEAVRFSPIKVLDGYPVNDSEVSSFFGKEQRAIYLADRGSGVKTFSLISSFPGISIFNEQDRADGSASTVLKVDSNVSPGTYFVTIKATDENEDSATFQVKVTVKPSPLQLLIRGASDSPNIFVTVGREKQILFSASGGQGRKTFSSDSVNRGITIDANSGMLTVSNSVGQGIYPINVSVSDENSESSKLPIKITVNPPLALSSGPLEVINSQGVSKKVQYFASGGSGDKTFALESEIAGVSIDSSTGILTISPKIAVGTYKNRVIVTDESGAESQRPLSIRILKSNLGPTKKIQCIKGNEKLTVIGRNPRCPEGYKKK